MALWWLRGFGELEGFFQVFGLALSQPSSLLCNSVNALLLQHPQFVARAISSRRCTCQSDSAKGPSGGILAFARGALVFARRALVSARGGLRLHGSHCSTAHCVVIIQAAHLFITIISAQTQVCNPPKNGESRCYYGNLRVYPANTTPPKKKIIRPYY